MRNDSAGAADEDPIVCKTSVHVTVADELPIPVPAELRYSAADPYAVRLSLGAPSALCVEWVFARSLLAQGLRRPAGAGDVVVYPRHQGRPGSIRVLLRTRAGSALLELASASVTAFLHRTEVLVPPGTEHRHIDLDRVVEQLTAGSE
ncbi:SsgA family sporulation/cell division regulator [Streptomyces spinosus]|uniref:SsgA family sporulation/cell division regulator n=1 Tax=Streptomyces spinosus TaxID=2872623 RepID=UPI001CED538A|nr:SsgA family sporulation/cell division regulator [Streptomyces spinosus]